MELGNYMANLITCAIFTAHPHHHEQAVQRWLCCIAKLIGWPGLKSYGPTATQRARDSHGWKKRAYFWETTSSMGTPWAPLVNSYLVPSNTSWHQGLTNKAWKTRGKEGYQSVRCFRDVWGKFLLICNCLVFLGRVSMDFLFFTIPHFLS